MNILNELGFLLKCIRIHLKVFLKDFSVKGSSKMSLLLCGGFAIKYTLFEKLQNASKGNTLVELGFKKCEGLKKCQTAYLNYLDWI